MEPTDKPINKPADKPADKPTFDINARLPDGRLKYPNGKGYWTGHATEFAFGRSAMGDGFLIVRIEGTTDRGDVFVQDKGLHFTGEAAGKSAEAMRALGVDWGTKPITPEVFRALLTKVYDGPHVKFAPQEASLTIEVKVEEVVDGNKRPKLDAEGNRRTFRKVEIDWINPPRAAGMRRAEWTEADLGLISTRINVSNNSRRIPIDGAATTMAGNGAAEAVPPAFAPVDDSEIPF